MASSRFTAAWAVLVSIVLALTLASGLPAAAEETDPPHEPPAELVTATPRVTGDAVVGSRLIAQTGAWSPGTQFSYQWTADGAAIAGATQPAFTLTTAQSGRQIRVRVTGTHSELGSAEATSQPTVRVMRAATPTITGRLAVGSTVTAKPGTWTSGTRYTYQWYANGTAIRGATKSTFKLTSAQRNKAISVKVTGRKSQHATVSRTSARTAKVATAGTVTISGTPVQGTTLTARRGTWTSGMRFSYQWFANGRAINGATKSTYKVPAARVGQRISVRVTGRKSGHATVSKTSKETSRAVRVSRPTIAGTRRVGQTLTARPGTWTSGTRFSYQWFANGRAISGATKSTYKIPAARVGQRITVRVTGRKSGHATVSRTSAATGAIQAAPRPAPSRPARTAPISEWNCPSWAPIKGNANSGIYHMPSGQYYSRTKPEACFRTEAAARNAGFRKSQR